MHVWALCVRLGERSRVSGVQDGAGASTRRVEPEAEDMRALVRKLEKELRALDDKVRRGICAAAARCARRTVRARRTVCASRCVRAAGRVRRTVCARFRSGDQDRGGAAVRPPLFRFGPVQFGPGPEKPTLPCTLG